jgi:hypothetical protein
MDLPRSTQEETPMANRKWLSMALGVVLVGLSAPVPIRANNSFDDFNKLMYVTFNKPVALPGVALGAGTYVFELPDPMGAWNVVRVSSYDRHRVYLTAFTRIVDRPRGMSPDQPISFAEAPANSPQPIKTWWPAGESTGRQFIYY